MEKKILGGTNQFDFGYKGGGTLVFKKIILRRK